MLGVSRDRFFSLFYGALGIGLFLLTWELLGRYRVFGSSWPAFSDTVIYLVDPARNGLYQRAAGATFSKAASGYFIGAILGLGFAGLVHVVDGLRPGIDRLSSFLSAIPAIALAPIFLVLFNRDYIGMAIATLNVYFTIYIAATSGLNNSTKVHRDLFAALGAGKIRRLVSLDMLAALPPVVTGLRYAISAALIGAIIGEWFGASRGLGVLIFAAMQNFQITLLWGAVLLIAIVSLSLYGLLTLLERFVYRRFT